MSSCFHIVSLSDHAVFTIITSALEAYKISHTEEDKEHSPIETYGNLWGYQARTKRDEIILRIILADVDTSATRTFNSAAPKQEAFDLKAEFVDRLMPELEYLGDFHSHPYHPENDNINSVLEVERHKYHCFSREDFRYTRHLQKKIGRHYRIGIVATVFEMPQIVQRRNRHVGDDLSCIRFIYDNLAIWLKCHVFSGTTFKHVKSENIGLTCSILGFPAASIEQN